jgi:4-hydroxybenzoate polyprenyltransferase
MGMLVAATMEPTAVMQEVTFLPVEALGSASVAAATAVSAAAIATFNPGTKRAPALAAVLSALLATAFPAAAAAASPPSLKTCLAAVRPATPAPLAKVPPPF